jgi:hypothetical protein
MAARTANVQVLESMPVFAACAATNGATAASRAATMALACSERYVSGFTSQTAFGVKVMDRVASWARTAALTSGLTAGLLARAPMTCLPQ